jgi:hypothetical protein
VAYNAALWSVEAVHKYTGTEPVSLDYVFQRNSVVPGLPVNFFDKNIVTKLKSAFFNRQMSDQFCILNEDQSLFAQFGKLINNTALKPDISRSDIAFHQHFQRLCEKRDSLDHIYPSRLLPFNPGSDVGLANLMGQMKNFHDRVIPNKYLPLKIDTNIFTRMIQVWNHNFDVYLCWFCLDSIVFVFFHFFYFILWVLLCNCGVSETLEQNIYFLLLCFQFNR